MLTKIDEDLKKFLSSDYGFKLINKADIQGQEFFKFGKKKYLTSDLKKHVDFTNSKVVN